MVGGTTFQEAREVSEFKKNFKQKLLSSIDSLNP